MSRWLDAPRAVWRRLVVRYPGARGLLLNRVLFENGLPLRINARYLAYLLRCRWASAATVPKTFPDDVMEAARRLRTDGYVVFEPSIDSRVVASLVDRIRALVDAGESSVTPGVEEWMIGVNDSAATVPRIFELITPRVAATLEAAYRSHFKIYSSEIYRLVPTTEPPEVSGLWHSDNYPPAVLKAMVYLTDCTSESGALRVHPRLQTRRLLRDGFFDRLNAAAYRDRLEQGWVALEGSAGTVVLWSSNIIHRATPPANTCRDAVAFKFLPSREPWQEYLARMGPRLSTERRLQYPVDPSED